MTYKIDAIKKDFIKTTFGADIYSLFIAVVSDYIYGYTHFVINGKNSEAQIIYDKNGMLYYGIKRSQKTELLTMLEKHGIMYRKYE